MIKRQPSLTIALFTLIFAGCNMFNNPLKPFIEEASRREGTPGVGPGDPGGVLPGLPGGPGEGTPGQPGNGQPGNGNGQPGNGNGIAPDPTLTPISPAEFLQRVYDGTFLSGNYRLTGSITVADLAVTGRNLNPWRPIATFSGTFDGGGHTITGIRIPPPVYPEAYRGMFAVIGPGSYVRNVRLVNVEIDGNVQAGGIAGINNGTVENSSVSGTVTGTTLVGGIVGRNYGMVQNSLNTATINARSNTAGGIVGHNSGTVQNSLNMASVSAEANAGGVVGWNDAAGSVLRCVALNQSVVARQSLETAHHIVGSGAGTLVCNAYTPPISNHARSTMTVTGGVPLNNGEPVTPSQYTGRDFWTQTMRWDLTATGPWVTNSGTYPPRLRGP